MCPRRERRRLSGTSTILARATGCTGVFISARATDSELVSTFLIGAPKTVAALKTKVARKRVLAEAIIVEQTLI
jgi:hypothetical protein